MRANPPVQSPQSTHSCCAYTMQLLDNSAGQSHGGACVSFGALPENQMLIAALGDGLSSSEDEDSAWLPPSGVVSAAESDPELTATLAQAAMSIGLKVSSPPNPECSWLDDWILDAALSQRCMKRSQSHGRPLLQPEATHCPPLSSLPLMLVQNFDIPEVERAVAMHLCPQNTTTCRNRPCLPSKACKLTSCACCQSLQCCRPGCFRPACHGNPVGPPSHLNR